MPRKRINRSVKSKIELPRNKSVPDELTIVNNKLTETVFFGEQVPPHSEYHYRKDIPQLIVVPNFTKQRHADEYHPQSSSSSVSWGDEFELENTQKLQSEFDAIERKLYSEEPASASGSKEELKQWKETFPHLRISGKGIELPKNRFQLRKASGDQPEEVLASHQDRTSLISCDTKSNSLKYYQEKLKQAVIDKICDDIYSRLCNKAKENSVAAETKIAAPESVRTPGNSAFTRNRTLNPNLLSEQFDSFLRISPIPRQDVLASRTKQTKSSGNKWQQREQSPEVEYSSLPYIPGDDPLIIKSALNDVPVSAKTQEPKVSGRRRSKLKMSSRNVVLPPIENLQVSSLNQYRSISATPRSQQVSSALSLSKLYTIGDVSRNGTEIGGFLVEENRSGLKQRSNSKAKRKRR